MIASPKLARLCFLIVFIHSKDCNLLDAAAILRFVKECRPEAILHFAAACGGIGLSLKTPASLLRDNVLMNFNILEAARLQGVKKTVMTLTTGMYPAECPNPICEESIHQGEPHLSNYGSSFAKRLVEPAVRAYREEYGMNVIGLVPNGILGEHSSYHPDAAIMPAALIRRFYENRKGDQPLMIWGDGTPLREITYAKDMARAFMWCLDHYEDPQILNVGTTEELSVREIALIIADLLKIDSRRIVFDPSKPAGQFRKNTDNAKFVKRSNFQYTPLRKTLEYTIRYFEKIIRRECDFNRCATFL